MNFEPSYMKLYENGKLKEIKEVLYKKLEKCDLCPRKCNINRYKNNGLCGANDKIKISEFVLYPGEEPPLTGNTGAGGIFFSNCSMNCIYCQNFKFSQEGLGKNITVEDLKNIYLDIQNNKKAVNLDLITATAYLPFIIDALILAIEEGFRLPIVWNTSSYENVEIIELLRDIVDIYLPDIRYTSNIIAKRLSNVKNYQDSMQSTLREIYKQIGNDYIEEKGILKRGIIVRILVLPNYINQAKEALKFLKYEISENIRISLMDQYVPVYKAKNSEKLGRFLKKNEYEEVVQTMIDLDLKNGWTQHHKLLED
ncbi:radical SAM protein [Oceanotoga sp. DSM 15011]|jgi:putative pyruvate formate lyase activating enzyme|uniref:Pyruvate formate lyase activating enzyme n=1 Tax=Oceanotoga teriensis TaxID=515440 RepID=A0AA45HI44_9BACT|nr:MULTISPECIES: radical SAM protein [Oceanotoga]MDO7977645.1 radical SAM protein [Oceanotoga teriensis]PWJ90066.1 putative pyruvate formate lyase activating enzyme [Oceanotoga teriensis]UYP00508.1 radical SAM protein [Oceanotoga sp. DSM 15011]